ncbi:hypothetical protein ART_2023 [Arthrobacter sp. PAMC 25486]|uniref:hypothetical protein n=1 Tax=Arthrobacter sp. PAMC 25486 TaxID=1494608 RepID=UPI000535C5D2|nr:hypothetical protein [Arthrobacter sp. PAMC 25486]AIY01622.1 hypothetical protein ART_2023 [Arthrobacter sp. PAMC 25486]
MESSTSDAHIHVEPAPSTLAPPAGQPLKIRWGRTAIALVGLLALLTAGISGALSVIAIGSATLPLMSLCLFAAVIVLLRGLAMRDQAIRRAARLAARATADQASTDSAAPAAEPKETTLFDGAEGAQPTPAAKPLTAEELRAAAMRVAAKGAADAKLAHTQTLAETWEPVEVPMPGYVKAARALTLEKPLNLPMAPKSAGTSIRADQAGVGVASGSAGVAAVPDVPGAAGEIAKAAPSERSNYALNNLDDVLQRRRA